MRYNSIMKTYFMSRIHAWVYFTLSYLHYRRHCATRDIIEATAFTYSANHFTTGKPSLSFYSDNRCCKWPLHCAGQLRDASLHETWPVNTLRSSRWVVDKFPHLNSERPGFRISVRKHAIKTKKFSAFSHRYLLERVGRYLIMEYEKFLTSCWTCKRQVKQLNALE
jgi:hypothetical protein